jgi:multiple sugar transport system substrate-binding protein
MRQALKTGLAAALATVFMSGAAAAQQKVVVWHIFGQPTEPGLVNMTKWDKANPASPIDQKFIPFGQLSQQLIKGIATGDVPDLITIDNPVVASFASQGALEDLTDLVKGSQVVKKESYFQGSWNTTVWQGRQYAVPGEANTLALYYNADMFRAKGLDPDKPPRTWAELKEVAAKLTDPSKNVYGMGFSAIQTEEGTFQWLPFLQQSGGNLRDLTSADAVAALTLWSDLVKNGHASRDALVKRQFEMTSAFLSGGSAMVISGPWELQRMDKDAKFEWRVAPLPVREGKNIEASALGGYVWGIPKGAKNRDLAFKVIEFMSESDQLKQAWSGGRLPPVTNITIENPSNPQAYQVFRKQMESAKARGPHPSWPQISAALQTAIQTSLTGRATPAEALERASTVVKPILEKSPIDGF